MTRLFHLLIAVLLATAWVRVPAEAQQTDCTDRNLALAACASASAAATYVAHNEKASCDRDCEDETGANRADCLASCRRTLGGTLATIAASAATCILYAPECKKTINPNPPPPPIHPSGSCPFQYDADVCELAGGTWDHRNEECNGA